METSAVCKRKKLKTTNTGIILFLLIPRKKKTKKCLCSKY